MELLYHVCYTVTTISTFIMAVFVLSRRPQTPIHRLWGLFNLLVCAWSTFLNLYAFNPNPVHALNLGRLCNYSATIIPVLFAHFCLSLVERRLRSSVPVMLGYIFCVLLLPFLFTPYFIPASPPKLFFRSYVSPGPLFVAFTVQFFSLVTYAFGVLWTGLRRFAAERQNQIRWVAVAMAVGFGFGSTAFLLVYDVPVAPHASLFTSGYVFIITYAIVKHQLLDIKVAVTRTGIALATYFIVLGGPVALSLLGQRLLEQSLGRYWWSIPVGLSTILATIGPFVYARLRQQADQMLLRELARKSAEATIDEVTGLLVRRSFLEQARDILAAATRAGQPCTLLMLDLDHFKAKNDAYGHMTGDVVLREVAARVRGALRTADVCGRFGGEEFIVLLPATPFSQGLVVAERIRQVVEQRAIAAGERSLEQTVSIGLATYPGDAPTLETLIAKADEALYEAKRAGRNRVTTV